MDGVIRKSPTCSSAKAKDAFLILLALAAVFVGGLIYIVHRTESLLMFELFRTERRCSLLLPVDELPLASGRAPVHDATVMHALRIGVLGSGKGSNFRAIAEAIDDGRIHAEVTGVFSDVESAGILDLARERGLEAIVVRESRFRTRLSPEIEGGLVRALQEMRVDLVVLAGYMRMVKAPLLEAFPRRLINIHPSLLPAFPGLEAWRQAVEAGAEKSGCTVHHVDAGMDSGEIIAQAEVPVLPGDTPASLHSRIQVAEHSLYPEVVARFARRELP